MHKFFQVQLIMFSGPSLPSSILESMTPCNLCANSSSTLSLTHFCLGFKIVEFFFTSEFRVDTSLDYHIETSDGDPDPL